MHSKQELAVVTALTQMLRSVRRSNDPAVVAAAHRWETHLHSLIRRKLRSQALRATTKRTPCRPN